MIKETPKQTPYQLTDQKSGTDSSYVRERKLGSDFQAHIRSHIGSFIKVSLTETRWFNSQTDDDDEFIHSTKTIFGTLKSVSTGLIEVDAVGGEVEYDGDKRSPVATGLLSLFFRHEQYDFKRFREIVEMQELSIEGKNFIESSVIINKENCA